jgi:NADH dehydrogenase
MARHTLREEFRRFDSRAARVILVEAGERVLAAFPPDLSARAAEQLGRLGVEVRTGAMVTAIDEVGVSLDPGAPLDAGVSREAGGSREARMSLDATRIDSRTVLWAAGVAASPLARDLNAPLDRAGRVLVEPDLSVAAHPEIFVIGDLASVRQGEQQVPGVAQAAKQMGDTAARNVLRRIRGEATQPFRYRDYATLATIGRNAAVAVVGRWKLWGRPAWLFWVFLHLLFLIGFRNRLVVMLDWAWAYATFERYARIAVSMPGPPPAGPALVAASAPRDASPPDRAPAGADQNRSS